MKSDDLSMRVAILEDRLNKLEYVYTHPPKFRHGDEVVKTSTFVNTGFVHGNPHISSSGKEWLYDIVNKDRTHIDIWGEDNLVLSAMIKPLVCKEE